MSEILYNLNNFKIIKILNIINLIYKFTHSKSILVLYELI